MVWTFEKSEFENMASYPDQLADRLFRILFHGSGKPHRLQNHVRFSVKNNSGSGVCERVYCIRLFLSWRKIEMELCYQFGVFVLAVFFV